MGEYVCDICGLHYKNKSLAEKCKRWCSKHDSCNFKLGKQSIEATEGKKK